MEVQNVCKGVRYIQLYGVPSPTRFHPDSHDVFSTVEILGYWKLLRVEVQWHSVNDGAGVSRQLAFSMLQICYLVVCSLIFKRNVKINEISVLEEKGKVRKIPNSSQRCHQENLIQILFLQKRKEDNKKDSVIFKDFVRSAINVALFFFSNLMKGK